MRQAYNTAIRVTNDTETLREIMNETADFVKTIDMDQSPADSSNFAYKTVSRITGAHDPYYHDKRRSNDLCLSFLPELREKIEKTKDPLYATIKASIFGNIIDLGIGQEVDIAREITRIFDEKLAIDDYAAFKLLNESGRKKILYLGDNAGEIVFDRLLIEKLVERHDITFTVKSGPVINDATMDDARHVGMTDIVRVIETGSDGIGVQWSTVSEEFMVNYRSSDVILSKGQGNFETMNGKKGTIFFLLKAKCDCVAEELGVRFGDIVFKVSKK